MPGFDGTGPLGRGPRTGWGRGYCFPPAGRAAAGTEGDAPEQGAAPQFAPPGAYGPVYGLGRGGLPRGCGRGFGGGRRRGGRFFW